MNHAGQAAIYDRLWTSCRTFRKIEYNLSPQILAFQEHKFAEPLLKVPCIFRNMILENSHP
jgi:hypothetical protein